MRYAKIVSDVIEKLITRPLWLQDSGEPVTDDILKGHGILPVVYINPEYDPTLQRLTVKNQSEWTIEPTRVVATYTVVDIPLEELREAKQQEITDMRWRIMTGGLTLPGGIVVGSSIEDQNRITSVVANAALAGLADEDEVDFKAESGWARISIAQVKAIAGAVGQMVQACYTAERTHHDAIEVLDTREAVAEYDVTVGWPE